MSVNIIEWLSARRVAPEQIEHISWAAPSDVQQRQQLKKHAGAAYWHRHQMQLLSETENKIVFYLNQVQPHEAQALREAVMADVPVFAFDRVEIWNSIIEVPDQGLQRSIELIPIKAEATWVDPLVDTPDAMYLDLLQERRGDGEIDYEDVLALERVRDETLLFVCQVTHPLKSATKRPDTTLVKHEPSMLPPARFCVPQSIVAASEQAVAVTHRWQDLPTDVRQKAIDESAEITMLKESATSWTPPVQRWHTGVDPTALYRNSFHIPPEPGKSTALGTSIAEASTQPTAEHIALEPLSIPWPQFAFHVYARDLVWQPRGAKQWQRYDQGWRPRAAYPDTILFTLPPSKQLYFKALARRGTGRIHAKYQAGVAYYRFLNKVKLHREFGGELAREVCNRCPEDVFVVRDKNTQLDIEDLGSMNKPGAYQSAELVVAHPERCTRCFACVATVGVQNDISMEADPQRVVFTVESSGHRTARETLELAMLLVDSKILQ